MNLIRKSGLARVGALAVCALAFSGNESVAEPSCSASAQVQRLACQYDLQDDFYTSNAQCLDNSVPDVACLDNAKSDYDEATEECDEVLEARLALCESLDDKAHEPEFGEAVSKLPENTDGRQQWHPVVQTPLKCFVAVLIFDQVPVEATLIAPVCQVGDLDERQQ